MDNEIRPVFDYGSIKIEHQDAAKEIADWLGNLGMHDLSRQLLVRFKIKENRRYDVKESKFYQLCQEAGVFVATQGMIVEGTGDDTIEYPLVAINGDIRQLDKFIEFVQNKK